MLDRAAMLVRIRGHFPLPLAVVTALLSNPARRLLGRIHLAFALSVSEIDDDDDDDDED